MRKRRTRTRTRLMAILFAVVCFMTMGNISTALAAGPYTIKSADDLEGLFPDSKFRELVFEAVKDGQDEASGTDLEDALANFNGTISANKKGIKDVQGLQYLRKATEVRLEHNEISEMGFLGGLGNNYFGGKDAVTGEDYNTTWYLGGNPLTNIPKNFGGWLIIGQMASTSSTYPQDIEPTRMSYVR